MNVLNHFALTCALAAAALPGTGALAFADTAMGGDHMMSSTVDCAKADAMMAMAPKSAMAGDHAMSGDHMMAPGKPTGDIDKDFAATMSSHAPGALAMAKTEAQCGKSPAMKKAAADLAEALEAFQKTLDAIKHTP